MTMASLKATIQLAIGSCTLLSEFAFTITTLLPGQRSAGGKEVFLNTLSCDVVFFSKPSNLCYINTTTKLSLALTETLRPNGRRKVIFEYQEIRNHLHFVNNFVAPNVSDRLWKVRYITAVARKKFISLPRSTISSIADQIAKSTILG